MNRYFYALLAPVLMILTACGGAASGPQEPPLAGAKIGGSFALIDQHGQAYDDSALNGQYRIMYFGYTYCPDVCPIDLQKIMQGLSLAEKADPQIAKKVTPLFITIDPERDGPEQMKQYVSAFHPRLIGLTGPADAIADVAKKFLIIYGKQDVEGSSEYLVDHSRQAYLFGPQGEPLALLPYDGTPQDVADTIQKWTS